MRCILRTLALLGACAMVDAVVPDVPYAHITPELLDTVGPSRDQWRISDR